MQRFKTDAVVLRRTNYKEADKVVQVITRDFGRLALIAKGVRRTKSRMAGGIEPFTVSKIEFIKGKGRLSTLVSARSSKVFPLITTDYDRAVVGGELLGLLGSTIEDEAESSYFELVETLLECLGDEAINPTISEVWFRLKLLTIMGRQPSLLKDSSNKSLDAKLRYHFDPQDGVFLVSEQGSFTASQIKAWRVLTLKTPIEAKNVSGLELAIEPTVWPLKLFMAENAF